MKTLTIYKGLSLRGASIQIYDENGSALPLGEYDFQFQLLDKGFNYLSSATVEADGSIEGKVNISMLASETSGLSSNVKNWALLTKNIADEWVVPVDVGKVDIKDIGSWS